MNRISRSHWYIGIFCLAILFSSGLNFINFVYVKNNYKGVEGVNTKSLVHDATIYNIDNEWYLPQAKNFLEGNGFQLEPGNPYSSVRRTPGYPLFFLLHVSLFGEENAHNYIRFTQIFLFAVSALLLALALRNILNDDRVALLAGYLYAVNPIIAGYNFYTVTEAIHPAFIIFSFYFFSCAIKYNSKKYLLLTGLLVGVTTLIRPTNGILLPAMLLASFFAVSSKGMLKRFKHIVRFSFYVLIGFAAVLLPWMIRNYMITKDVVLLEKFYHEDAMGYGKGEKYVMKWLSSWSNRSQTQIFNALLADTANRNIPIQIVSSYPANAFQGSSRQEVLDAFYKLQDCVCYKVKNGIWRKVYKPYEKLPPCEEEVAKMFRDLTNKNKSSAPFRNYIVTPYLIKGKEFLFHSFSTHLAMLNPDDGVFTWWQKLVKGMMYLSNLVLWGSLLLLITSFLPLYLRGFIFLVVMGTLIFFVNVATVEVRYMLIAYPFMYVTLAVLIWKIVDIYQQLANNHKIKHIHV